MGRDRFGKALVNPAAPFERSLDGACTGHDVLSLEIVHQYIRTPTCFKVAIVTWASRDHLCQKRESRLFLAVGSSRWRGGFEALNTTAHIGFEPTADGVLMAASGLGNGGNTLAPVG